MNKFKFSIIGYPLNKPRSVPLWKKFFKKKKIKIKMNALEIKKNNINNFLKSFKKDKNFYASAVTMPLKENLFQKVLIKDKITKIAKSVNLILKNKNKIYGYNTDMSAFLKCIPKKFENVLIFGFGGTGKPIFNLLYKYNKFANFFIVTSKYKKLNKIYKYRSKFVPNIDSDIIKKVDLIINCTPLGSNLKKKWIKKTPISSLEIQNLKKNCTIFDLVYKPKNTTLSKLSKKSKINYINGIKMNTLQAEDALKIVFKSLKE